MNPLEYAVFIILLVAIAAALDLWLLRTWKRLRRDSRRGGEETGAPENKPSRISAAKPPAAPKAVPSPPVRIAASGASTMPEKSPSWEEEPLKNDSRPSKRKRGGKPAASKAALSVAGKSGRTAHVSISMDLPEGESIRVTLESVGEGKNFSAAAKAEKGPVAEIRAPAGVKPPAAPIRFRLGAWLSSLGASLSTRAGDLGVAGRWLFTLAIVLYLLTRLIGLTRWPIYFFTDEAVQTNFAAELVGRNFIWNETDTLPVFFENAGQYEMNLSVYVQILPYLIFGKSVFVTRAVSVLITLLAAAGVAWILRRAFHLPLWWSGVLLLSMIPVWFLHSRTAFEPGEAIAFYAMFLYFYTRYREDKPWMLLPALVFGALSAYTYSPMQIVVAVTGVLLLISDAAYHLRHWKIALAGLAVLILMASPYLWFLHLHPEANRNQLAIVSSYWVDEIPLADKLKLFFQQYLRGLDPRYWFLAVPPEGIYQDIIRHLMKGYGHIALWSLPFVAVGIILCLTNIRNSHFRTVLAALLAAPAGGAIAQITITRTMVMVIPISLLTALGVSWLLALFERPEDPPLPEFLGWWKERIAQAAGAYSALRDSLAVQAQAIGLRAFLRDWGDRTRQIAAASRGIARIPRMVLAVALFLVLGSANVYMLWDALTNGPTWYENYELYGMQYGGEQLTAAMVEYKDQHPEANLIVSSSWANGTDEIFGFFLPQGFAYRTGTVLEYMQNYIPIQPQDVFVMTSEEYGVALASQRFSEIRVEETVEYPNGKTGFYFAHLTYVGNIQEIIAAEKAEQAKPVDEQIVLGSETVRVVHSRFDMGNLAAGFDNDLFSLMRTQTANPMVLDMYFPEAHSFTRISVRVGGAPTRVAATFYPADGGEGQVFSITVERASDYRDVEVLLPSPIECSHIKLEIETVGEEEPTHVHVYEVRLEGEGWKNGVAAPSP